MIFNRIWAMPNSDTFSIKPIKELLQRRLKDCKVIIDPFARNSKIGTITNDLNPDTTADFHMEAVDFCDMLVANGTMADAIIFDPPYSPRQRAEVYQNIGKKVTSEMTRAGYLYKPVKDRLNQLLKPNGIAICFGWNSNGMGVTRKYTMEEILLVPHGGEHYDSIVTVERKI